MKWDLHVDWHYLHGQKLHGAVHGLGLFPLSRYGWKRFLLDFWFGFSSHTISPPTPCGSQYSVVVWTRDAGTRQPGFEYGSSSLQSCESVGKLLTVFRLQDRFAEWRCLCYCRGMNGGLLKDNSTSYSLEPVNVHLFGRQILVDVIQLRIVRWDGGGLGPKSNDNCF